MMSFEEKLQNYADLAIKIGLNLQPGQHLLIQGAVEVAPLIRLLTTSAYKAGARFVDVMWDDDSINLSRFQHAPKDSFETFAKWRIDGCLEIIKADGATLVVRATDPDLLDSEDSNLVHTLSQTREKYMLPVRNYIMREAVNWAIIGAPVQPWAAKLFPDKAPQEQMTTFWDTIFRICRADQADPIAAWKEHIETLRVKSNYLTEKRYSALKYTGPGTNLTVGLPRNQVWKSAGSESERGIAFTANIPTEEVFTMPHRERVDGIVTATKPLYYNGVLIENLALTFEQGKITKMSASRGENLLRRTLEIDEGAKYLGEVALVPHSSPISQSGLLFYDTLFDENAASHLALGRAYRFNLKGGTTMSEEDFEAAGGNFSMIHMDFMIGSNQIDVDGIKEDGSNEPVMRGGEWAF